MRTVGLILLIIIVAGILFALIGKIIGNIPQTLDFKLDRTHENEEDWLLWKISLVLKKFYYFIAIIAIASSLLMIQKKTLKNGFATTKRKPT